MKKRIISSLLVGMLVVSLLGCGNSKSEDNSQVDTGTSGMVDTGNPADNSGDFSDGTDEDMDYKKVDKINIDSGDTKLEFEKAERTTINDSDYLIVYFNFTNVSVDQTDLDGEYSFLAFQDGVEITVYSDETEEIEATENRFKLIQSNTTIEVAIIIEPENWDSSVTLRVDDQVGSDFNLGGRTFQEQEIQVQ
jgi:hypothetical protein